jgi:integrase
MLAFKLGLRAGEVYALRWSDIDFSTNTINICKQLQYQDKKWCFTTLKTPNSYRKIKFDEHLKEHLTEVQQQQLADKEFFEDMYKINNITDKASKIESVINVNDLINIKQNGEMLNTNSCKVISRICKSDLNMDFKMHNLRHTHATMLLEKGLNPKYASERLGHSKLELTLKLYTHITRWMDEQAVEALNFSLD